MSAGTTRPAAAGRPGANRAWASTTVATGGRILARLQHGVLRRVPPAAYVLLALALTGVGVLAAGAAQQTFLILAAVAAVLVPVSAAARRGRIDPLDVGIAVAAVYLLLFPLRSAVVLLGLDPTANKGALTAPDPVVRDALVVIVAALLAGGIAHALPFGARLGARVRIPSVPLAEHPPRLLAAVLFFIGAAAQSLILAASRNPDLPLIGGRGSGLVGSSSVLMLIGLCLFARRATVSRARADIVPAVVCVAAAAVVGLVGQFKEVVLLSFLAPMVMCHYTLRRGLPMRWLVLATAVAVFIVFPLVTVWRQTSVAAGTDNPLVVATQAPAHYLDHDVLTGGERRLTPGAVLTEPLAKTSQRLYGFDSVTLAVRYTPSLIPHRRGATLERLYVGVVPRILWANKPRVGIGYWFSFHYWGTPVGAQVVPQTVTHPGELYIDFGLAGVIAGMALLGLWYRFAYAALRPRQHGTAALVYTVLLLTVISVDRDLPLVYITLLQRLVALGLLLAAAAWISRRLVAR